MIRLLAFWASMLAGQALASEAVVRVVTPEGSGSGVVVSRSGDLGIVATALHVVKARGKRETLKEIEIHYRSGDVSVRCYTIAVSESLDIAILRAWVPPHLQPAVISDRPLKRGDKTSLRGFPAPLCEYRSEEGYFIRKIGDDQFHDSETMFGFSGGGIFRDGKLVGIAKAGMVRGIGKSGPYLWPNIASSPNSIPHVIKAWRNTPRPPMPQPRKKQKK